MKYCCTFYFFWKSATRPIAYFEFFRKKQQVARPEISLRFVVTNPWIGWQFRDRTLPCSALPIRHQRSYRKINMGSCFKLKIYQCLKTVDRSFTHLWRIARNSAAEQPNVNKKLIRPNTQAAEQWHMLTAHENTPNGMISCSAPKVRPKNQYRFMLWAKNISMP